MSLSFRNKTLDSVIPMEKVCFYFVVVDVLFFPYFRFIHMSFSIPFVVVSLLGELIVRKKSILSPYILMFFFFSIASIMRGILFNPTTYIRKDLFSVGLIYLYMAYYLFYKRSVGENASFVVKVLKLYLWFVFTGAIIFAIAPQQYFNLRSVWQMSREIIIYKQAYFSRYTYIVSDPNNCGCLVVAVLMAILVMDKELCYKKKIIYCLITSFSCVVTLSTTGFLVLICSMALYCMLFINLKKFRIAQLRWLFVFSFFAICILIILFSNIDLETTVLATAKGRILDHLAGGTASGRKDYWIGTIKNFNWLKYIVLGCGVGVQGRDGYMYPGYSGHFQLILYYGFISYISFMYIFFRKPKALPWKTYICLFPAIVCFSVNVGLEDYRTCSVFVLISALYHSQSLMGGKGDV